MGNQDQNPLSHYFRAPKLYVKLPSNGAYYEEGFIEYPVTESEVAVMPMTGKDEMILKNPDALLNGEAIISMIKSCCPTISDPRKLLTNDIEVLTLAIRYATYENDNSIDMDCPKCNHSNHYKFNIEELLERVELLESEYIVNLSNGATVVVQPYNFELTMKMTMSTLDEQRIVSALETADISDEVRMSKFSQSYLNLAQLNFDTVFKSVIKVIAGDTIVEDRNQIREFINNISAKDVEKIEEKLGEINKIGIPQTFKAVCSECKHEWNAPVEFNPVNFFTDS